MPSAKNRIATAVPLEMRNAVNNSGNVAGTMAWRYISSLFAPSERIERMLCSGTLFDASRTVTSTWKNTVIAMSTIFGASARPSSTMSTGSSTTFGSG